MKNKHYYLLKTIPIFFGVLILLGTFPKHAISQENEILYALVEYYKVKPENTEKYLQFVENILGPVQHERMIQNEILNWRMFKILFTGTSDEYNYVSAVFFHDFGKIESARNIDFQKVYPGKSADAIMQEFFKVGDLVKTEVLEKNMNLSTINGERGKFLLINFMNVKQGEEGIYQEVEKSIWKPVHQELVNNKAKSGWDIWRIKLPGGSCANYQFMAVDVYNDFTQIGNVNYSEIFSKVHQNEDSDKLLERTNISRIWVKSEIWESLDDITAN